MGKELEASIGAYERSYPVVKNAIIKKKIDYPTLIENLNLYKNKEVSVGRIFTESYERRMKRSIYLKK
jgi:hypothetical protein